MCCGQCRVGLTCVAYGVVGLTCVAYGVECV